MGSTDNTAAANVAKNMQSKSSATATPPASGLSAPVGIGAENRPDDVFKVSSALAANGLMTAPQSHADSRLYSSIIGAQERMDSSLKRDGLIRPGGPTEGTFSRLAGQGFVKPAEAMSTTPQPVPAPSTGNAAINAQLTAQSKQAAVAEAQAKAMQTAGDVIGDLPRFTTDAINTDPSKAIPEIADLLRQVHASDPKQAQDLFHQTAQGITPAHRDQLNRLWHNPWGITEFPEKREHGKLRHAFDEKPFDERIELPDGMVGMPDRRTLELRPEDQIDDRSRISDLVYRPDQDKHEVMKLAAQAGSESNDAGSPSKPKGIDTLIGGSGEDRLAVESIRAPKSEAPIAQPAIKQPFLDALHKLESNVRDYDSTNNPGTENEALGRYQMTRAALQDAGLQDADGKWTSKHGIKNAKDFLTNPQAQERAFNEYMLKTESYVKKLGLEKDIGTKFTGKLGKPITITQSGLMAAAHRQGAGYVDKYLKFQNGSDWKSNFSTIRDTKLRKIRVY